MGRSILHRKSMQNRRRLTDPDADHLLAATHYKSEVGDAVDAQRENPHVPEPTRTLTQTEYEFFRTIFEDNQDRDIRHARRITEEQKADLAKLAGPGDDDGDDDGDDEAFTASQVIRRDAHKAKKKAKG